MPAAYHIYESRVRFKLARVAVRHVRKVADYTQDLARRGTYGPYSQGGELAKSILTTEPIPIGTRVEARVYTRLHYARAVERGSGLHGPSHRAYSIFAGGLRT